MKKHFLAVLAVAGFAYVAYAQNGSNTGIPAGADSGKRFAAAVELGLNYFEKNGLDKGKAVEAVIAGFTKAYPEVPAVPSKPVLDLRQTRKSATVKMTADMDKVTPVLTKAQLAAKAEARYPLYKVGDEVKVSYLNNPNYPSTVSGKYYGCSGGTIRVGKHRVRLADMVNVENNTAEILKFDAEAASELRNNYMAKLSEEIKEAREDFVKNKSQEYLAEEIKLSGVRNEKAGYTCVDGTWMNLNALAAAAVIKAEAEFQKRQDAAEISRDRDLADMLNMQAETMKLKNLLSPAGERVNPQKVLEEQAAIEKKNRELAAAKLAAEEEKRAAAEEEKRRAEEEQLAAARAKEQQASQREQNPAPVVEVKSSASSIVIIVVAALLLVGSAIGFIIYKVKKNNEKDRFKKFFEGKGKVQKDFWAMADADPEHFKFVAYMFPSLKEANKALQALTYIQTSPNGDLRCSRDIHFGAYPHLEGAVAFVGGSNMHYATWREASAVFPELPNATYFKVSTEPEVILDIPDIEQLATEKDLKIENIGIEEISDLSGGFMRCYKYRTDSIDSARAFLEDFLVHEEGIIIHVETPDGILGKDETGIFMVEDQ